MNDPRYGDSGTGDGTGDGTGSGTGDRSLDAAFFVAWIDAINAVIEEQASHLSRLDAAIGDGDHGTNLKRGFRAAVEAVHGEPPPETPGAVLVATGRALIYKVGGASGPLYGGALRRSGKALGDRTVIDPVGLGTMLRTVLEAVQRLGQAVTGDKTMVDALIPAVAAYDESLSMGDDLRTATRAAADAALEGARGTVPLLARKGRASYLGERSIGHEDPGAASSALILAALADVAAAGRGSDG